jgi:hypothetical protein
MPASSGERRREEVGSPPVGEDRAVLVPAIAQFRGKAMVEPFIIEEGHMPVVGQPVVHGFLCFGADQMIGCRDMQQQRLANRMLFAQQTVDADAIIADERIAIGAAGRHIGQPSAQTVTDQADFAVITQGRTRRLDRGLDILDALILIELPEQSKGFLQFGRDIGVQLDMGTDPPEQVWRIGQIARLGPIVAFLADAFVDAEDFLDDDDRRGRRLFRGGDIGVEGVPPLQRRDGL